MRTLIGLLAALALVTGLATLSSGCCKFQPSSGGAAPRCSP